MSFRQTELAADSSGQPVPRTPDKKRLSCSGPHQSSEPTTEKKRLPDGAASPEVCLSLPAIDKIYL